MILLLLLLLLIQVAKTNFMDKNPDLNFALMALAPPGED
jgi:hypothetical protein